jgi:hypothetical protein
VIVQPAHFFKLLVEQGFLATLWVYSVFVRFNYENIIAYL